MLEVWTLTHTPSTANWALHSNRYCRFLASSLDSAGYQCQPEVQFTGQHAIGLSTVRHRPHRGQRLLQPGSDRRTANWGQALLSAVAPRCMSMLLYKQDTGTWARTVYQSETGLPLTLSCPPPALRGAVMQGVIPLSLPPRRTAWCRRRSTCRCGCASRGRSRPASSGRRPPPPALPQRRYRCPPPKCFVRAPARPLLGLQTQSVGASLLARSISRASSVPAEAPRSLLSCLCSARRHRHAATVWEPLLEIVIHLVRLLTAQSSDAGGDGDAGIRKLGTQGI